MYFKTSESSRKHHWQQLSWNLSENNLGNPDGWLWYRGEVSEYTMASNAIQTIMFKDRRRPKETHQALIGYMQGERIRGTSPVTPWQCLMKRPPSCVPLLLGLCRFLLFVMAAVFLLAARCPVFLYVPQQEMPMSSSPYIQVRCCTPCLCPVPCSLSNQWHSC